MPSSTTENSADAETIPLTGAESSHEARRQKVFNWVLFIACVVLIITCGLIWWLRGPYEFLIFSQNYTVSNCIVLKHSGKNCSAKIIENPWTIHGIWPSRTNDYPAYCQTGDAFKFNVSLLQPIKPELDIHWPSADGNNAEFWRHEWEKHGTCALDKTPLDSELKFFEQGLKWNKEFNIEKIFNDSGIYPSDNKNYTLSDFQSALKDKLGVTADIACYHDNKRNASILLEVELVGDGAASNARRQRTFYRALLYAIIGLIIIILFILWWRPYQFLIFSQTYSVGYCAVQQNQAKCSVVPDNRWTIHGIWPTSYDSQLAFCKRNKESAFNEDVLAPIIPQLYFQWPSADGDNSKFWKHEWEKHGTCAPDESPLKSELQYFQQALNWNQQYPIKEIFEKHDIRPSDDRKYQLSDFLYALETELGVTAHAVCRYSKKRNANVLEEVRICFSMSLNLISCDTMDLSCADDDIYYLKTTKI